MHEDMDLNRIGVSSAPTPEEIAEYMETPEGALELQQRLADMKQDQGLEDGSQIGASLNIPGATRGPPLEQIGASPNIRGATRGPSSGIGGIIPEDENRRRMRGVLSGQGLGY